jgi:transposase
VKPYVQTNKSDYIDAEAIAEAVQRPRMRFVPIKSEKQLDLQAGTLGHATHGGGQSDPQSSSRT